jgi:hypothetical protein
VASTSVLFLMAHSSLSNAYPAAKSILDRLSDNLTLDLYRCVVERGLLNVRHASTATDCCAAAEFRDAPKFDFVKMQTGERRALRAVSEWCFLFIGRTETHTPGLTSA